MIVDDRCLLKWINIEYVKANIKMEKKIQIKSEWIGEFKMNE